MKSISFALQAIVLAGLALLSGLVHGRLTNRWGEPPSLMAAAERLDRPPQNVGPWRLQRSETIEAQALRQLECPGYFNAIYERQRPGRGLETVRVAILVGPPGPISVHTPDVCYANAGYKASSDRESAVITPEGASSEGSKTAREPHSLWRLTLEARSVDAHLLRVYYGWSANDGWRAAKHPRISYASKSHLYKILVAGAIPPAESSGEVDPCRDFLVEFLPVLDKYLVQ